ncbi:Bud site selection protein 6 [Escovopsis weberi]|uniref:Bud site selection protein 6 n=1 Tax=Escovopsis weberi TaxID=150374 RepID=A0A0M8N2H4_ESCWE|nr:Bud site selection protein 6 [Escovopsis weberi]
MQAAASQRGYSSRRSPGAEPGPPQNMSVRPVSPSVTQGQGGARTSNHSIKSNPSAGSRRSNREGSSGSGSNLPLSQIEKSVTHLLVATKQLLETLTQWSRGQATDTQVSDVYVRLGYEFNMACRAFTAINVDTSDLGNVPDLLRTILEATLSQEASAESLERYLPRIRDIIINLLHGLKRKQQKLRQKQARDRDSANGSIPERTTSVSTIGSTSGISNLLEETLEARDRPDSQHRVSGPHPSQTTSASHRFKALRDLSSESMTSEQSSLSSTTMQSLPVMPPYPTSDAPATTAGPSAELNIDSFPPPPPPPPPDKQSSALAALQKGGDLERRASRRYSQYQISKHLGSSGSVVPMLPSQTGPLPNRGRKEARESLRAVQSRETGRRHSRAPSSNQPRIAVESPVRRSIRIPEEPSQAQKSTPQSPATQKSEERLAPSATLSGPGEDANPFLGDADRKAAESKKEPAAKPTDASTNAPVAAGDSNMKDAYFQVSPPPTPTKDLTLFLQYKSKVKKIVLPEGRDELSIGRLQLAFIEKFSWNTQQNGTDLPEIYIQDPVSGVRHELEDLGDIKDRTVLVLNVEPLDEVKRHIDDGMLALTKIVQDIKQNVDDQASTLKRVSDKQQETSKEMAELFMNQGPSQQRPSSTSDGSKGSAPAGPKLRGDQIGELQSLRRDLAVLRQTYSNYQAEVQASMSTLRAKAANVKTAVVKATVPDMEGDVGYSYVSNGRKQLNADSDRLVAKVDDFQDMVEDLRKDVVHRGVRPLPRQLEGVAKDVTSLNKELKRMEEYLAREKPIWTKIWEKELEDVCQGRDELRLMEDLLIDLRDDLEKASETFALVEQATKEQMKDNGTSVSAGNARQFSKGLNNLGNSVDQSAAKEYLLGEVRALQPNHQDRLDAIERAEKLRQKELESRTGNPMHHELRKFVKEGKLRKSGGVEEVERARMAKDEKMRKDVWDAINGYLPDDEFEDEEGEYEEEGEEEGEEGEGEAGDDEAEAGNEQGNDAGSAGIDDDDDDDDEVNRDEQEQSGEGHESRHEVHQEIAEESRADAAGPEESARSRAASSESRDGK